MRDKNCTTQHCVTEQIGELSLTIPQAGRDTFLAALPPFAKLCAADFSVKIEFSYTPEDAPRSFGPPDTWDDGCAAEVIIKAIRADAAVHFDGDGLSLTAERGVDLLGLFDHRQIEALEDRLHARAEAGSFE